MSILPERKQSPCKQDRGKALSSWIPGKFSLLKNVRYLLADVPRPQWQLDPISASDKGNGKQIPSLSPLVSEIQVTASLNALMRYSYVTHVAVAAASIWLCFSEVWEKIIKDASENAQSRSDHAFLQSPADTKLTACYCCAVVKLPRVVALAKISPLFQNLREFKRQD